MYARTDRFVQDELEFVPSLNADRQIWEDKEALFLTIKIFKAMQARDAASGGVATLAIGKQAQLLVGFWIGQHGIKEVAWVVQIPRLVFVSGAERRLAGHTPLHQMVDREGCWAAQAA